MKNPLLNFYRQFYIRTNGYIPAKPIGSTLYPGDFFQMHKGEIVILGNIFRNMVISPGEVVLDYNIELNPANWYFNDGISKPYYGRGSGNDPITGEFEFYKQIIGFTKQGSFIFHAAQPSAVRIVNWNQIKQELIIRLTQTIYSFRELYVITETAGAAKWRLAVAGAENAEIEIAGEYEQAGPINLFNDYDAKIIQSRDIEVHYKEQGNKPCFFKAKKLLIRDENTEVFISNLINSGQQHNAWAADFFDFDSSNASFYSPNNNVYNYANVLDMLAANELNPNTALNYFRWADATLDDVEKLFIDYV